ncbi:MAG TPA: hypothetical protein DCL55_09670 [Brevundimonas sp.]|nr:hypothetical protein [Brevundimonas sp.]
MGVFLHGWMVRKRGDRSDQTLLSRIGLGVLIVTWGVLVPITLYLWREGLAAPWLFGAETYDGGVVETVTAVGLILIGVLAVREAVVSRGLIRTAFWSGVALFGVLAFGEEASWGQHIFQWSATGAFATANLQAETNLHNFVSPRLYDIAYAVVGWGMVVAAGLLSLRPPWLAPLLRQAPLDRTSVFRIALLVSAGALLQHELFEEMAEAVAILAFVFIQAELALTRPATRVPAHQPAAPCPSA